MNIKMHRHAAAANVAENAFSVERNEVQSSTGSTEGVKNQLIVPGFAYAVISTCARISSCM